MQRLYAMSELAQELIKLRATAHNWALPTYPGRVKLPGDILRPLQDGDAKQRVRLRCHCSIRCVYLHAIQNVETSYLPESAMSWIAESTRAAAQTVKRERNAESRVAKRKAEPAQKGAARQVVLQFDPLGGID